MSWREREAVMRALPLAGNGLVSAKGISETAHNIPERVATEVLEELAVDGQVGLEESPDGDLWFRLDSSSD